MLLCLIEMLRCPKRNTPVIPIRFIKQSDKKMFLSHNCLKKVFPSAAMKHFFVLSQKQPIFSRVPYDNQLLK